ncbi:MAG: agmatine deiminase family protein [Bacteroidetes bacterium]|nr:agmatine deiminase family protein [Bacteroidota bacterium]MBU1718142.1 agmatine deiminase family protein [Bacteroidota bacterium]
MKYLIILISSLAFVVAQAQVEQIPSTFKGKTHTISPDELGRETQNATRFTSTNPPPAPVRNIAEFERSQGVIVSYLYSYYGSEFGIPISLIAELSQDAIVYTLVKNSSEQSAVNTLYIQNSVNLSNCLFVTATTDSYWTRDFSPWFIVDGNSNISIVDFPYNRPRPNDNLVPVVMGTYLNLDVYGMNLTHTGGNYMTNGMGIAASTTLVQTESGGLTVGQIEQLASDFLGIDQYYIVQDPLDEYIEHIDCWGKFLDIDKILIGEVPSSDPRYADFEAMAAFWEGEISSYNTNFQVFRTYSPNSQPYTNSLILNNKVLVPVVTGTGSSYNNQALDVYRSAMPGYEVIGFTQASNAPWEGTDALHCRTHEVPDLGMLYIRHIPILGEQNVQSSYDLTADITTLSDSTLYADSVKIIYNVDGGAWQEIIMTNQSGNTWIGSIPGQAAGSTVSYYLYAADKSGRRETHPFIGQPDPHVFTVEVPQNIKNTDLSDLNIRVYPNPVKDFLNIRFETDAAESPVVNIYNVAGQLVHTETGCFTGRHFIRFNLSSLSNGAYIAEIVTAKGSFKERFAVVK